MSEVFLPITLPSQCLVYKDVDPSQIGVRTLKGKDELLIAEMSGSNFDKKFLILLKNVLKGIDPEKLTTGDKLYITIWLVINSYSKIFPIEFECEHCWQKAEYQVDLSTLKTNDLPGNFKEPYTVKLPKAGVEVDLRLLRYSDLLKVSEMEKQGKNPWIRQFALSLVNDKNLFEKEEFLENLDGSDLAVIRCFHEKFFHGPKMEVVYECPKCGGTGVMPVPFRLEMLLPFGKRLEQYIGDAI